MHDIFWYGWKDMGRLDELAFHASNECKTEYFWLLHEAVDYTDFDLNFLPDRYQRKMLHAWPAHNNPKAYTTWLINSLEILVSPEKVYHEEILPSHAPPIGKDLEGVHWEIDERIDYSDFEFDWLPDHWSFNARHTFCLKHKNSLGYTHLLINDPHASVVLHPSDLVLRDHYEITELKMVDNRMTRDGARSQRYFGNMEAALRTAIRKAKREWLWVISDIIDYDFQGFDFGWLPDGDQKHFVHCWPSNSQVKGETFLIHVPTYEDGRDFEFCFEHRPVARMPWPIQHYSVDNLADAIRIHGHKALYTQFNHLSAADLGQPYPCLWDDRPVIALNRSGSCSLVPRDCIVDKEIYEYPHLERDGTLSTDPVLDIVFISNGEKQADANKARLGFVMNRMVGVLYPSFKEVKDCQGRLNSYREAARLSNTDWFIAVFAKCCVTDELAMLHHNWTPDYWQEPKHYIFHNHNLDNGLTYGHMAPIAYNKRLILDNPGGLDITLAQKHTVVPIVLSETTLEGDNWTDWRTAFRETVKLMHYNSQSPTIDSEYRLHAWMNTGTPWAIKGAQDGKDFYERCGGDEGWLLLTVEWDWLKKYYDSLYS